MYRNCTDHLQPLLTTSRFESSINQMVLAGGKACDTQVNDKLALTTTRGIEAGCIINCGDAVTISHTKQCTLQYTL